MATRKYYAKHRNKNFAYAFDSKGLRDYYCKRRYGFEPCTAKVAHSLSYIEDKSDRNNCYSFDLDIITSYEAEVMFRGLM